MEISLSSNASAVIESIKKRGIDLSRAIKPALSKTAQHGVNIILDRTEKGIGYKGAFKPYSELYGAFRDNRGRGQTPDLNFTGQMLGNMTTKVSGNQAEIFFSSAQQSRKAAGNNKSRPFFGFNREEAKELGKVFERFLP